MNSRFKTHRSLQSTKFGKAKLLIVMMLVLLFAMVASTAAQEDVVDEPAGPAVPEPVMNERIFTPEGVEETWTFFASKDSFLSSANANENYGLLNFVKAGYDASNYQAMRMLFEFNISTIPKDSVVHSASMSIYQEQSVPSNDANMGLQAQYMKSPWCETTSSSCTPGVTWNNANYLGGDIIGVGDNTAALGWKTIDVTNLVREWVSQSRANYGFIVTGLESPQPNRSRTFAARERAGLEPRMTVNFDQSCDNVAPTAWVETLPAFSPDEFKVSWTGTDSAPDNCTPVGIAYYDVQYNINGGEWHNWQSNNTGTSATFKGASNGQTYGFRARAVDKAGNVGAWQNDPLPATKIDTVPPTASVNPLPEFTTGPNFQVSWSGTDNAGGSGIATYDVAFRKNSGEWDFLVQNTTATSTSVTGAENEDFYEFAARATDNVGNVQSWPEQAEASTTVINNPIAVVSPFDPLILQPSAPVTTSFTVNWKSWPTSGVNIASYEVRWKFNNGSWSAAKSFPNNVFTWIFDELRDSDGTYYFEARAVSGSLDVPSEEFTGVPEAFKIVDLEEPFYTAGPYLPLFINN